MSRETVINKTNKEKEQRALVSGLIILVKTDRQGKYKSLEIDLWCGLSGEPDGDCVGAWPGSPASALSSLAGYQTPALQRATGNTSITTYMHTHAYIYTHHTYTHLYTHTLTYTHTHIQTHITHIQTCTYIQHTHTSQHHTHIHIPHTHLCTHTPYTYTYKHTSTHKNIHCS